jgi:hypothetical protein
MSDQFRSLGRLQLRRTDLRAGRTVRAEPGQFRLKREESGKQAQYTANCPKPTALEKPTPHGSSLSPQLFQTAQDAFGGNSGSSFIVLHIGRQ